MRITALAGLFACATIFAASVNGPSVSAQSTDILNKETLQKQSFSIGLLASIKEDAKPAESQAEPKKPEPQIHEVKADETLSSIAVQYDTTWQRIFNKNENITDPDVVSVGQILTIPSADEQLSDRQIPLPPVVEEPVSDAPASQQPQFAAASSVSYRGSSSGNTYAPGYCTWYTKNRRPDLPNNLGNANTWYSRAAAMGLPVGSTPRVGAIGTTTAGGLGHTVYVESINSDGTVNISEMNYVGWNKISTRTVPASSFQYIY